MAWYNDTGKDCDVVLSSRIRLARNIAHLPFDGYLSRSDAEKVINDCKKIIEENSGTRDFEFCDFEKADAYQKTSLCEKHLISPEFAKKKGPHALIYSKDCDIGIMLCEEDHLRIQAFSRGLSLSPAYDKANKIDDLLSEKLEYAFSEKFGYLTKCPTNLGTAMRASVMVFLPALSLTDKISDVIRSVSKMGICVRGFYGEGSKSLASIYQISSDISLGISEEDMIKRVEDVSEKIAKLEREERRRIFENSKAQILDKIGRSCGILKNAYLMSSNEFFEHYKNLRLGISLGAVDNVSLETLDKLFVDTMPATLICENKSADKTECENSQRRDMLRAQMIKKALS